MTDTPRYPTRTGRQGLDAPPPEPPDTELLGILTRALGKPIDKVAADIRAAGYRKPTTIYQWGDLMDYPPGSMLTDRDGRAWSVEAVPEQAWDRHAPWTLIHTPPIGDVLNK